MQNKRLHETKSTRNRKVRKHFSGLYSLVTPGPSYPFLGVSSTGVGIFWGCTVGLLFGLLVRTMHRMKVPAGVRLIYVPERVSRRKRPFVGELDAYILFGLLWFGQNQPWFQLSLVALPTKTLKNVLKTESTGPLYRRNEVERGNKMKKNMMGKGASVTKLSK